MYLKKSLHLKRKIRRRMSTTFSIRYSPALPRRFKTRSGVRGGVLVHDDTPESRYFGLDENLYLDLLTVGIEMHYCYGMRGLALTLKDANPLSLYLLPNTLCVLSVFKSCAATIELDLR